MSKKRILLFSITVILLCLFVLYLKKDSPFGWLFFADLYGLVIGSLSLVFIFGHYLFQKRLVFIRILGISLLVIGSILTIISLLTVVDYRIVLPFTKATPLPVSEVKEDLEYFQSKIKTHPGYTDQVDSTVNKILAPLYEGVDISRDEFVATLMSVIGLFNDGHSFLPPFQVYNRSKCFPLAGHYFDDGYYILKAADEYTELKNKKLVAINNLPVNKIFEQINQLTGPESSHHAKARVGNYLFSATTLYALDIIPNKKYAIITYLDQNNQEHTCQVSSTPFTNWFFWAFKPMVNPFPVLNNIRKPNFELTIKNDIVWLELNLIENIDDSATIKTLAETLHTHLATKAVTKVIIDLRNNLGGNNQLYRPIIEAITKHSRINQKENLFVLTSSKTFSAGINFLDELMHETNATVIGKPTAAGSTHYGDAQFIRLPHSGIFFFLSTKQWTSNHVLDTTNTIHPHIQVAFNMTDYLNGEDPWLKAIDSIAFGSN